MATEPGPWVVINPFWSTLASSTSMLDHDTVRPVSGVPDASRATAVACVVCPTVSDGEFNDTETDATGAGAAGGAAETSTDPVVLMPSTVAVITALPADMAVTTPLDEIFATTGSELDHVTKRFVSVVPLAVRAVTASGELSPAVMFSADGDMDSVATGTAVDENAAVAVRPSAEAEIVAVPTEMLVTTPPAETLATTGFELDQVVARSAIGSPAASRTCADSVALWPTKTDADDGRISIDVADCAATTSVALPTFPSAIALIVAGPLAMALMVPLVLTVATAGFELCHAIGVPMSTWPFASRSVAEAVVD